MDFPCRCYLSQFSIRAKDRRSADASELLPFAHGQLPSYLGPWDSKHDMLHCDSGRRLAMHAERAVEWPSLVL